MSVESLGHPICLGTVYTRTGTPPTGMADLCREGDAPPHPDMLVAAGQAMIWRSAFSHGAVTALPLSSTSALLFNDKRLAVLEHWHHRFARGAAHRMAGELTIASVAARLVGEATHGGAHGPEAAEDAELLSSAIDGLAELLADLEVGRGADRVSDRIAADTMRTHVALLGQPTRQWVSTHDHADHVVHTVRTVWSNLGRSDLEHARARIALPWPSRLEHGVGHELGLARWRSPMESSGHQMWCRVEDDSTLVTELWLRNPGSSTE